MTNVILTLSPTDAHRFTEAVQDVAVLVNQAENVFAFLALVIQGGDHEGHFGIADMAALASKALAGFGERQNEDLANLSSRLSQARKARKDQ